MSEPTIRNLQHVIIALVEAAGGTITVSDEVRRKAEKINVYAIRDEATRTTVYTTRQPQ